MWPLGLCRSTQPLLPFSLPTSASARPTNSPALGLPAASVSQPQVVWLWEDRQYGTQCVACSGGQTFVTGLGCTCTTGLYLINGVCGSCPSNTVYNSTLQSCSITCGANSIFSGSTCVCYSGYYNISGVCQMCPAGTAYNSVTVSCTSICGANQVWANSQCSLHFWVFCGERGMPTNYCYLWHQHVLSQWSLHLFVLSVAVPGSLLFLSHQFSCHSQPDWLYVPHWLHSLVHIHLAWATTASTATSTTSANVASAGVNYNLLNRSNHRSFFSHLNRINDF